GWFMVIYGGRFGTISLASALSMCVIPFIPVDLAKLASAILIAKAVEKRIVL
ncbi:MAG: biotin transporter BioY, partial [Clostridia bacterium]|nr:biotin transporter BioY [Clostridia bacterium]